MVYSSPHREGFGKKLCILHQMGEVLYWLAIIKQCSCGYHRLFCAGWSTGSLLSCSARLQG